MGTDLARTAFLTALLLFLPREGLGNTSPTTCSERFQAAVDRIFEVKNEPEQKFQWVDKDSSLRPRHIKAIENVLANINHRIKGYLLIPENIKIETQAYQLDADSNAFNSALFEMNVPYRMKVGTQALPFAKTAPIIAHEYGHLLLYRTLMEQENSQWRRITQSINEQNALQKEMAELASKTTEIRKQIPLPKDWISEKGRQLYAQAGLLEQSYQEKETLFAQAVARRQNLLPQMVPYDELFADVVGVLFAKDGKAMTYGLVKRHELALKRDFTLSQTADPSEVDPHLVLNEVRSLLWKKFTAHPEVFENPGPFLKNLATLIDSEASALIQGNLRPSAPERNRRLIEKIEELGNRIFQ